MIGFCGIGFCARDFMWGGFGVWAFRLCGF